MDNRFQNQVGYLDWQFMIEEFPVDPDDPNPPTGDDFNLPLYIGILGASGLVIIVLVIFLFKKKKQKRGQKKAGILSASFSLFFTSSEKRKGV
jgi:hypothetical protein